MRLNASRILATVLAALYLLFFAIYLAPRPNYVWDNLAYVAIALEHAGIPRDQLHAVTFGLFHDYAPQGAYDAMTGNLTEGALAASTGTTALGDLAFREEMANSSDKFLAQLPFFEVKPVYPALMTILYEFGINPITAGMIISVAAFFGIGMVLFFWFAEWMPAFAALCVMALLVINPWLILQARNVGPDILSVFLLLLGAYLAFGYRDRDTGEGMAGRPLLAAVMFLVAVAVRPENILYAVVFLLYLGVRRSLTIRGTAFLLCGTFVIYFAITLLTGSYGWSTLFHYTFINRTQALGSGPHAMRLLDYINFYLGRLDRIVLGQGELPVFALVALGGILLKFGFQPLRDKYVHLIVLAGIIGAARMVVLPTEAFRALLPCYMLVTIACIQACAFCKTNWRMASGVLTDPNR